MYCEENILRQVQRQAAVIHVAEAEARGKQDQYLRLL